MTSISLERNIGGPTDESRTAVQRLDIASVVFPKQTSVDGTSYRTASFIGILELKDVNVEIHLIDTADHARLQVNTFGVLV